MKNETQTGIKNDIILYITCLIIDMLNMLKTVKNTDDRKKLKYMLNSMLCLSNSTKKLTQLKNDRLEELKHFDDLAFKYLVNEKFYD